MTPRFPDELGCGACRERKHQNRPRCPRHEAVDEKAGKRRFIQSYIYHMQCNKSATKWARFVVMMKKIGFSQIAGCKRRHRAAAKAEKWNLPLVEKQRIWYNILHDAPSPSGKAGDFDSPIVGSTPAGATKSPVILKRLTGLFASLFHKMRLNGAKLSGGGSFWWACGGSSCSKGPTQSR